MDVLFIVRDALASSLVTTLLAAADAQRTGRATAVLVTQEALAAVAGGTLRWPQELSGQHMRYAISDHAADLGVAVRGRGASRQVDASAMIGAAQEAGVTLHACPIWTALLGLDGAPAGLTPIDRDALTTLLTTTPHVVGSL